ncbi:uncharacterized protein MELLADRAFT_96394 [Melampsora larici-populina 98AG31]|uniref:Peptidase M16 N-terminal domain-containing protein n=1 Tax=Melampsora larici-populina (strain 98AG31 / pathotype 3-4-7) TaxID=747676 RepID=F4REM4_MELLP|nr:uncharacterized protein MELLADRAFT_96394 [Melampsora larici-populina 98AG31]EGG09124.1 hypothetical protein MELLADRAFT_96394 [Melampsora larici-populina 98AG31]
MSNNHLPSSEKYHQIENLGAHLNAYSSREKMCFFARGWSNDVPKVEEIIQQKLMKNADRWLAQDEQVCGEVVTTVADFVDSPSIR